MSFGCIEHNFILKSLLFYYFHKTFNVKLDRYCMKIIKTSCTFKRSKNIFPIIPTEEY